MLSFFTAGLIFGSNKPAESPHSYEITTTAMVSATASNQVSVSGVSNTQNQNNSKTTHQNSNKVVNPVQNKTSPPKVSPASPDSSNSLLYPAVLGRGAVPLQKSRVPPPVPPRGSPKPKRDMPANRGNSVRQTDARCCCSDHFTVFLSFQDSPIVAAASLPVPLHRRHSRTLFEAIHLPDTEIPITYEVIGKNLLGESSETQL